MKFEDIKVDFYDPDFIELYENEMEELNKFNETLNDEEEKESSKMRRLLARYCEFVDNLFGNGLSIKLFGEKPKFIEIMNFFDYLAKCRINQDAKIEGFKDKYSNKRYK